HQFRLLSVLEYMRDSPPYRRCTTADRQSSRNPFRPVAHLISDESTFTSPFDGNLERIDVCRCCDQYPRFHTELDRWEDRAPERLRWQGGSTGQCRKPLRLHTAVHGPRGAV